MNIVFLDAASVGEVRWEALQSLGSFTSYELTAPGEVIERCLNAEVIITNKVKLMTPELRALPNLRMICIAATGMNNVDLQEAERLGIAVRNVANYSTDSVAQVTVAMVLSLIHRPALFDAYVKSGTYSKSPVFTHHTPSFYEIRGKKWGIIGLGTIGKRVAELATALGADVSYYSTSGKNLQSAYPHLTLEALASQSDILSVHAPLNEQTQGLINQKILHCMKPEALLINVGRGGIVAENDLAQALREKRLAGAGIDVFETEPVPAGNPLLAEDIADRLLLTPHLAWASSEARQRLIDTIVSHIRSL